ncbi:MAG: hypothetical protein LBK13_01510, partial [Spirochaetales bacterium]|nr:hypothetical protein [Spirochaetales bacterium]
VGNGNIAGSNKSFILKIALYRYHFTSSFLINIVSFDSLYKFYSVAMIFAAGARARDCSGKPTGFALANPRTWSG